jgi:hypothetical protein
MDSDVRLPGGKPKCWFTAADGVLYPTGRYQWVLLTPENARHQRRRHAQFQRRSTHQTEYRVVIDGLDRGDGVDADAFVGTV